MGGNKKSNKRPRPSYEEGKLRDPAIEHMQDERFQPADLQKLIKRAVTKTEAKAPKGASS